MRPGDARAPWTPPVSVVLVGCGAVARSYYAPALARLLAGGWVGAVRTLRPEPGTGEGGRRAAAGESVAPSWEVVLEGPDELAIVASPPVAHAEQVRALLEHGKHVLCEKPFALDRAAGESLVDLARERGLLCAVGMVRRFSRSACLLRQLLSEERPTRLVWHEGGPFRWPVDSPAYFAPEAGNRLLWDIGSHVVDLLIWWLGVPPEFACRDDAMGGTATNCVLELEWPDGCSGEVRLSREYELAARARRRAPLRRPRLSRRGRGGRAPRLRRGRGTGLRAADPGVGCPRRPDVPRLLRAPAPERARRRPRRRATLGRRPRTWSRRVGALATAEAESRLARVAVARAVASSRPPGRSGPAHARWHRAEGRGHRRKRLRRQPARRAVAPRRSGPMSSRSSAVPRPPRQCCGSGSTVASPMRSTSGELARALAGCDAVVHAARGLTPVRHSEPGVCGAGGGPGGRPHA